MRKTRRELLSLCALTVGAMAAGCTPEAAEEPKPVQVPTGMKSTVLVAEGMH